jgi:nicotinate phosphoribosyltransferase
MESPTNPLVTALLTDLYQITMTYAHWKSGKHKDPSVFELFFRKNPFDGAFTIFCGLDECLKHIQTFGFSAADIDYLKTTPSLAHAEDEFFEYLACLNTRSDTNTDTDTDTDTGTNTKTTGDDADHHHHHHGNDKFQVHALAEGTVVFPRVPMIIIEAPLGLGQLLETTLLNLVNYPSLICTNAARMVMRAKPAPCIEFGLRRAQGPDGACSASKYSYVGGFVATSNVQAGKMFGIPISGTHAHSFVQSFASLEEVGGCQLFHKPTGTMKPFLPEVLRHRNAHDDDNVNVNDDNDKLHLQQIQQASNTTNDGELAAFCAYACAFPDSCLCLIDTYDTLRSGLPNFIYVALALSGFGYTPKGVRLDSGDLAALSWECRRAFETLAEAEPKMGFWKDLTIVASNDINEDTLHQLQTTRHGITAFGIGTNLVTCQKQPALGCVYKLVEWKGQPRIKLSQDFGKITIPGKKRVYRLMGRDGKALVDYMTLAPTDNDDHDHDHDDMPPQPGQRILCRHPFQADKRWAVTPTQVICLHSLVFPNNAAADEPSLSKTRDHVQEQLQTLPTELVEFSSHPKSSKMPSSSQGYDVLVSQKLFEFLQKVWEEEAPVEERR